MGACLQKHVREKVDSKSAAIVPSWASSPGYIDDDEGRVKLVGDVTCPYTQRVRIALLHKVSDMPLVAVSLSLRRLDLVCASS